MKNKLLILIYPAYFNICREGLDNLIFTEIKFCQLKYNYNSEVEWTQRAQISYLQFTQNAQFTSEQIRHYSQLSFCFALFLEIEEKLLPIDKSPLGIINSKMSSMLKYQGKTNELFTRTLIQCALLSCQCHFTGHPKLLDPMVGKGTSLYEGLLAGCDVYGIDCNSKIILEAQKFTKKYLESEKYKHTYKFGRLNNKTSDTHCFTFHNTKEALKYSPFLIELTSGNTEQSDIVYKKNKFHLIVTDLPYGIVHNNKNSTNKLSRNPKNLLESAIPAWNRSLKKGGVLVIAWNNFLLSKKDVESMFANHNFEIIHTTLEHRVDQSIRRDVLLGIKK